MEFQKQLSKFNITSKDYLKLAKYRAKKEGYNSSLLKLSDDNKHKLMYKGVKFGAVNYNDFILYSVLVVDGKISKEEAYKKRLNYRKRAFKVMNKTNDKFSPSALSYFILW